MPTKRTRRSRGKQGDISTAAWYFLNDALHEAPENSFDGFDTIHLEFSTYPHNELQEVWNTNRSSILKRWLLIKPGTRPHCWWLLDAPKLPEDQHGRFKDTFFAKGLKEPRKRLSGIGTPAHEVLATVPCFKYGVSIYWVDNFQSEYYSGTAKDIHGKLINPQAKNDDFKGIAIDPIDPPLFESQASYLDRFGLLSAAEKKKSNFEPESVLDVIGSHLIKELRCNND